MMATLSELRQKYPEYSDMSDQQLADSFYEKYYSDMPKNEFYKKLEFQPMGRLEAAGTGAKYGWGQTFGGLQQLIGKGGPELEQKMLERQREYELAKEAHPWSAGIGSFGGTAASLLPVDIAATAVAGPGGIVAGPAAALAGRGATRAALSQAPKAASYGQKVLRGAGEVAPAAGLAGGVGAGVQYMPEDSDRLTQSLMGATLGTLGGAAIGGGIQALRPSNIAASITPLGPEELARRAEVTRGTQTNLGRAIEDPFLSQVQENVLAYLPGTGGRGAIQKTRSQMEDKAEGIFDKLARRGDESVPADVKKAIEMDYQSQVSSMERTSSSNFRARNERADELGLLSSAENAKEAATSLSEDWFKNEMLRSQASPDLINQIEIILKGEPRGSTLTDLQMVRSNIRGAKNQAEQTGDASTASALGRIEKGLTKDIEGALDQSNDPLLRELNAKANEYFADNIAPLRDPKNKILRKYSSDKDLMQSESIVRDFARTQKGMDRGEQIDLIKKYLSEDGKNMFNYAVLGDEMGDSAAMTIRNKWNALGEKQKNSLFPPGSAERIEIEGLVELAKMNPKAFHQMFNPETGKSNLVWESAKVLGGLVGAGAAPGAAAGYFAGGRALNTILTNPKIREAVIDSAIKGKTDAKAPEGFMREISKALRTGPRAAAITGATRPGNIEETERLPRGPSIEVYTAGEEP